MCVCVVIFLDLPDDIVTEGLSEDEDDDEDDNLNDNGIVEMDEHCSRIDAEAGK